MLLQPLARRTSRMALCTISLLTPWGVSTPALAATAAEGVILKMAGIAGSPGEAGPATSAQPLAPTDLNGDGSPDLVWRNTASGAVVVWYLNGTIVVSQGGLQTVSDPAWQLVATADMNADGHPDAIWRNTTTGANRVWYLDGTTIVSQGNMLPVSDLSRRTASCCSRGRTARWPRPMRRRRCR